MKICTVYITVYGLQKTVGLTIVNITSNISPVQMVSNSRHLFKYVNYWQLHEMRDIIRGKK